MVCCLSDWDGSLLMMDYRGEGYVPGDFVHTRV